MSDKTKAEQFLSQEQKLPNASFDAALAALREHRDNAAPKDMRAAFAADPGRFGKFSLALDDLLLDWSKCAVDAGTMAMLERLAAAHARLTASVVFPTPPFEL